MANEVTLNSAVRSNLRTLQSTTQLLNQTEERLASGKKISSALDGPANFFTANALDRRATDLNSLLDSVSNSVKTLETADNGIKAINDIVETLKATARSALQSPSTVSQKAGVTSAAVEGLTSNNLTASTKVSPATLRGTGGFAAAGATAGAAGAGTFTVAAPGLAGPVNVIVAAGDDVDDVVTKINAALDAVTGPPAGDGGVSAKAVDGQIVFGSTSGNNVTLGGATATLDAVGFVAGARVSSDGVVADPGDLNGQTLIVKDRDGISRTVSLSNSGVNTIDELNKFFSANNVALTAKVTTSDAGGQLVIESSNAAATSTPPDIGGTLVGAGQPFVAGAFSVPVLDSAATDRRASFVKDFNDNLKQIDILAKDSHFNGVNLLNGDDLDIIFNEDGSSKLEVKGVDFNAAGIGLEALTNSDFYDPDSINAVLDKIGLAFDALESLSSKFGSQLQIVQTREVFTKDMIGTLEDGANNLTGADTNEEAANLATLQTRQSLIVSSLSISTQQESAILQLLR